MQQALPKWQHKMVSNPAWVLVAALGTNFCRYGFRKPYTVATYDGSVFFGATYKSLLIIGRAIWIGAVYPAKPVQLDALHIVCEIAEIKGLHSYNYDDFAAATTFIEHNYQKYPSEKLIKKERALDNAEEAFRCACENKPLRLGIKVNYSLYNS